MLIVRIFHKSHVDTIHVVIDHDATLYHGFSQSTYPGFLVSIISSTEIEGPVLNQYFERVFNVEFVISTFNRTTIVDWDHFSRVFVVPIVILESQHVGFHQDHVPSK